MLSERTSENHTALRVSWHVGTLWLGYHRLSHLSPHFLALFSRSKDAVFQSYELWDHLKGFTLEYHFLIFSLCPITGKAAFCPVSGMVGVAGV